jgi:hypothetical protein
LASSGLSAISTIASVASSGCVIVLNCCGSAVGKYRASVDGTGAYINSGIIGSASSKIARKSWFRITGVTSHTASCGIGKYFRKWSVVIIFCGAGCAVG